MQDSNGDQSSNTSSSSTESTATKPADQAVSELKSTVVEGAHDLKDQAKNVAGGLISHARESAGDQISSGKDRVAEGLGSVADALRHGGEHLRSKDASSLTEYASRAADQVEAASDYLKETTLNDLVADVGSFARREPAMFLGGAFVLGLVGGRFLKSSHAQTSTKSGPPEALTGAEKGQSSRNRQGGSAGDSSGARATRKQGASARRGDGAKLPGAL